MAIYDINGNVIQSDINASYTPNPLYGKVLVTAGDSITSGEASDMDDEGNRKTYGWYAAKENGMVFVNRGISGSCLSVATKQPYNAFSDERYKNLPSEMDYLIIYFGTNDVWAGTLGTKDDTDNTTFYGAWKIVLPYLINHHPNTHIGIIIPWGTSDEMKEACRWAGNTYGIPYLDLSGDPQVPLIAARAGDVGLLQEVRDFRMAQYLADGVHPNDLGYQRMGRFVSEWLKTI